MSITASPGIFEVDLLFPRNATYSPQALTPIVWALQNPSLASPLTASITWSLWEGNNQTSPGSIGGGLFELSLMDFSSSEPHLVSEFVNTVAYPDGDWTLAWSLSVYNCSQLEGHYHDITRTKSGREPDLVAATSADECGTMEAYAFKVTSFGDVCGDLGPTPTTNPRAVTINSTATSSLYALIAECECDLSQRDVCQQSCGSIAFGHSTGLVDATGHGDQLDSLWVRRRG
ncbi:uncharacterized protein N7484_002053 [Penicillium longicatenatum]|uniref:uncharacterized protein n=1 Tax=Penicillium longicatenatum TaxID=1561947 RepID=UPI0025498194|nr:uncharacterized protein N7484_002053 [Penicillium longicatenatum]KAJ5658404.1 hypothetical protein N7484_002053 [Penicillium longicatenatum]